MSVSVDIPGSGGFAELIQGIGTALETIATDLGIDCGDVHIVSTVDFDGTVDRILRKVAAERGDDEPVPFTTERVGGLVAGKTLAHARDYRDATLVLNGNAIDWTSPDSRIFGLTLAAHELGHVVIGRARYASGVFEGEATPPSRTGTEYARSIARTVIDEFRADWLANGVVGGLVQLPAPAGGLRPMTIYDICGPQYVERLGEVLVETVHPGWPDTVMSYQMREIDLDDLQRRMIPSTEGVMSLVSHAEAHAYAGGVEDPLVTFANLRGTELYVRPAWRALAETFEHVQTVPPSLAEVRALEERIAGEGTGAILAMWKTLGLTVEERANREWALWVSNPER
jgi:hypothetical protein